MPRYHSLDTEVQLCTWDPLSHPSASVDHSAPTTQTPATESCSTSNSRSGFNGAITPYGYDQSHKVKRLTEEYFEGCKGLDFLGCDVPFFLIHAGNDSSNHMNLAEPRTGTKKSLHQDHIIPLESSEAPTGVLFPRKSSTISKVPPGTPYLKSTGEGDQKYRNDANEVYLSSDGSSPSTKPSKEFLSPYTCDLGSADSKIQVGSQELTSLVPPEAPKVTADKPGIEFRAPMLETVAKPVEVIVKLSEKSFVSPIFGTETNRHDICINLFYNGEFNTSQVIEYRAWAIDKSNNVFNFGGRRIGRCHERSRIMTNISKDVHSNMNPIGKNLVSLTTPERWNRLAEMFRWEANEWGRDERGYRYPTGEYLELLSKKAMPFELNCPPASTKCGFGVIDVVITFGRVSHVDTAGAIGTPLRNLPASQFQKTGVPVRAHFGSRTATPTPDIVANFSRNRYNPQFLKELGPIVIGVNPTNTPNALSASVRNPSPLTRAPTTRPPHPNKPENVPQKRYRGSDITLPQSPPSKRQKTPNLFTELPFDLSTATYMSTRARRGASVPSTQTPPNPLPESSIKRKRGMNQVKSGLSGIGLSETSTDRASLIPKKDKMSNPKTPESGGTLKKKPRISNYNPKLSNRPQNLRRKNSAGQWVIPLCRRNSLGEWETPTKGGQAETGSYGEGHSEGIDTGERKEIFQPVFTIVGENTVKSMATVQDATHQTSPSRDKTIYPDNSTEAERLALTVATIDNKKEKTHRNDSGGWSNEIAIAATTSMIASPPPGAIFRVLASPRTPLKGNQSRDLLSSSRTAAEEIVFQGYFGGKKNDSAVSSGNNAHRKKILCMRFSERKMKSDEEIIGEGCGNRRWQVRRCVTPENILAQGSGKRHAFHPSSEIPRPKFSTFTTGSKGEKFEDVSIDGATRRSHQKPVTNNTANLRAASNSVTATRRGSKVVISEELQLPVTTQPQPRLVVPDHNSRVLKVAKSHPITIEKKGMKHGHQDTLDHVVGHGLVDKILGNGAINHFDGTNASDTPLLAAREASQRNLLKEARLEAFFTSQTVSYEHITSLSSSAVTLAQKYGLPQRSDSGVQILLEDQASKHISADRMSPKRPLRPRTVGSTELKALLESHDCHNAVNTSFGTPLGIMHPQPLTRASRKSISFMPRKVVGASEVFVDNLIATDKPAFKSPVTRARNHRQRSTSSQFIEETKILAIAPKHAMDTDGCISEVTDAHTSNENNTGSSNSEVGQRSQRTHTSSTPDPPIVATISNVLRQKSVGELPLGDIATSQAFKKVFSRSQKVPETPKGTVPNLGEQPGKRTNKFEAAVDHTDCKLIDKSHSYHPEVKAETLHTRASNAMNFQEVAGEVRAKTEINMATEDLESLTARISARSTFQKAAPVCSSRDEMSTAKTAEELRTDAHKTQEKGTPYVSAMTSEINTWKPSFLSDTSILKFAKNEDWDSLDKNPVAGQLRMRVGVEEEGCFKEFGILMGVRYVVVGSGVIQEC